MKKRQCPICKKAVLKSPKTAQAAGFFPFCSERCKLIDLGRWFESEYTISSPIQRQKNNDENSSENMLEQ